MMWPLLTTAFTTGLLGSLHCLGMCGGVSATVAAASGHSRQPGPAQAALAGIPVRLQTADHKADINVLAFNTGRILSYGMAGALAGAAGALAGNGAGWLLGDSMAVRTALFFFANVMIVFTGFFLMGVPQFLAPLEIAGSKLWSHLSPLTPKLLPVRGATHAAAFGALWGWIPCGMVYAMLLTALSSGHAIDGALTMLAFGAGTIPAMLGAGFSAGRLLALTRNVRVRQAAGFAVVAIGIFGMARMGSLEQLRAFGALCGTFMIGSAQDSP